MAYDPDFEIQASRNGTAWSIALVGELDGGAALALAEEFQRAISQGDFEELILDMQKISFIDSAGMRAIIEIERTAREKHVPLVVMPPPAAVTELFHTTGLAERLTLGPVPDGELEGPYIERIDLTLPCDPTAPGRARTEVRSAVPGLSEEDQSVITLLTSELVTNAVIHPPRPDHGQVGMRIVTSPSAIRVEVTDAGPGFDPERPEPREPERGGRGLLLVDRLASRWGASPRGDRGFCVWFELDAPIEAGEVAEPISAGRDG
jgi:anti-anti-sigma factor